MNYLWAGLILAGIIYASLTGSLGNVTEDIIEQAKAAVSLAITLLGVIAMWTGLMKIAEKSGMIAALTRGIRPILNFLFPRIPDNSLAKKHIATNFIANMLGLGWAATPAGLSAMKELQKLNKNKSVASIEMCTFLIINISSVQLVSINIIAYRTQFGSLNPTEIIGPSLIATTLSTLAGVIFCKIMMKVKNN